ncbi:hypothetical protein IV102_03055 [bacterium]|nr:hypothetical protein [bacterium]
MKVQNYNTPRPSFNILKNSGGPQDPQGPKDDVSIKESYRLVATTAATAAGGATAGYFGGELAGGLLTSIGAGARYAGYMPAIGLALGTSWGVTASRAGKDDPFTQTVRGLATLGSGGTLGMVAGDALGHGLTAITGTASFAAGGALAGAITGGLVGLSRNRAGKNDILSQIAHGAASTSVGMTSGWFLGGGTAALLSKVAPNAVLGLAPTLGAVSGGLIGLAAYLSFKEAK